MTLARYVTLRFLYRTLQVSIIVAGLGGLLSLVENIRVAAKFDATIGQAVALTLLQIPDIFTQSFPLILMLASLATFLGLSRSSEMVIVRASGVSAIRMLLWPVIAAFLIGSAAVAVLNPVAAFTTVKAGDYRAAMTSSGVNVLSLDNENLWLRQGLEDGKTVIQANSIGQQGTALFGLRLHQFNTENKLIARIEAASATLADGEWILYDVRRWNLDLSPDETLPAAEQLRALHVPTNLTREQIQDSFAQPQNIAIWLLPNFIRQLERAGFSATRHRVYFQSELARPTLFAAMVLIGAGFSLRHVRFGQVGIMILMAVTAGFSLYFLKDVSETLGANGDIPILLAAWAPPLAAVLLALGLLLHLEDG